MMDSPQQQQQQQQQQRKEIYTYAAPWTVFSLAWSNRLDASSQFRLAIGSYVEQYSNAVRVLRTRYESRHRGCNDYDDEPEAMVIYSAAEIEHPYPCTKILWSPEGVRSSSSTSAPSASGGASGGASGSAASGNFGGRDLLATTGDYLRLWSVGEDDSRGDGSLSHKREALLINNSRNSEYCSPLTSFDWNETDPSMIVTSSIDTTCTLWDIHAEAVRTQVIAHDKEVFDLAFSRGVDVFASVGADGSVRLFDLRRLEHSTIIYETPNLEPLLRLEWNRQDPNYLATFMVDSQYTIILDIRQPCRPVAMLGGHAGCVNAVAWAPHSSCHVCTAGDDSQALIWDISGMGKRPVEDPILAYNAEGEVNNLQWSTSQPDWVSIAFADKLQILRV
jgi:WD repeat-containing protein 68